MAFPRHFRGERQVYPYFWVIGAVLGCFLLSFWLLSPSSELVQQEATLSIVEEPSSKTEHESTQTDEQVKSISKNNNFNAGDSHQNLEEDPAGTEDSKIAREDAKSEDTKATDEEDLSGNEKETTTDKNEKSENIPPATAADTQLTMESQENAQNWSSQIVESKEEIAHNPQEESVDMGSVADTAQFDSLKNDIGSMSSYNWKTCNGVSMDYIPCLDNKEAIKRLPSKRRFQHRERHCPNPEKFPMCLVPLPKGYKVPIRWPQSRHEIWLENVPHTKLVSYKKDQNWMTLSGDKLLFPGGGTQFKYGALPYIDSVEQYIADVSWGKHTRVALDIGCGVASFGGFLFDRNVLTMSFAPKDEHEAQVQLALERGIPAISAVMGTQRLPFPSNAFDLAHCARCRIHWHGDDGKWLLEINRILRPGGYFVWSATPVYNKDPQDVEFWEAMVKLTQSMCWHLTLRAEGLSSGVGFAIYQKPMTNLCYKSRSISEPPLCVDDEKPDAAWYIPLESCLHRIPTKMDTHGATWPPVWPERLYLVPEWLNSSQKSLFGKPASTEFEADTEHWSKAVSKSYMTGLGIDWKGIRNIMDMKAGYGGFAAALVEVPVWVMNVVSVDAPDTLPVIFDRGLLGIYHDWCESFSTYPRTYDLLHVDHLFEHLTVRCKPILTLLEMDRLLRPQGWVIFREKVSTIDQIRPVVHSLHWNEQFSYTENGEQLWVLQKSLWRPNDLEGETTR